MNTNQGAIILAERTADDGTLRSILREWGYRESEIQRRLANKPCKSVAKDTTSAP